MSYLADTLKKLFSQKIRTQHEIDYAEKVLKTTKAELQETEDEIIKIVSAVDALDETQQVADEIYSTYPDVDLSKYGLPAPPVDEEQDGLEGEEEDDPFTEGEEDEED